jgi:SEC-C motif-containing protein
METDCPCGSDAPYDSCCGALHRGTAAARTAEQLMRSRYSAFAVGDADYLLATWHPSTRPASLLLDPAIEWRRLRIGELTAGTAGDETGSVAFVAHYWDPADRQYGRHHETSRFARLGHTWFYVEPA